jgi:hypothetical protein
MKPILATPLRATFAENQQIELTSSVLFFFVHAGWRSDCSFNGSEDGYDSEDDMLVFQPLQRRRSSDKSTSADEGYTSPTTTYTTLKALLEAHALQRQHPAVKECEKVASPQPAPTNGGVGMPVALSYNQR